VQGYNAQAVATKDQILIAAEVAVASPDFGHLEPMLTAARDEVRRAGIEQPPDADAGGELYAVRQTMIEPIFADTRFDRRIDRFLRRGRAAVRSEWRLTNAAHNLLKLWRHTSASAAA